MISYKQLQDELLALSNVSNTLCRNLVSEKGRIHGSSGTVQQYFTDQEKGMIILYELGQAMREVQNAYDELEQLKSSIIDFSHTLAK